MVFIVGVTITTLTGENGIIQRAVEAREETEEAEKIEQNTLNSYEDTINEYMGIDWDRVLANAEKHPDQKTSTAIGVGTDGRAVNMDLWIYSLYDNGYALNSLEVLDGNIQSSGYLNENIETDSTKEDYGKIKGTIPTYISEDNGATWKPVVNLNRTFYHCTNLVSMPEIPITVVDLSGTFMGCSLLENIYKIPDNVTNMTSTFYNCISLKEVNDLPKNLINMSSTFHGCTSLENICGIPDNVTNMSETFWNCTSLENIYEIPDSVTNMSSTFWGCTSLENICEIPDNVTNMYSTFRNCVSLTKVDITIPVGVINIRNMFNGCIHLYGSIKILANLSLEQEGDGYYSYSNWLYNASTESEEELILGPIENRTLIEKIKPNNDNIKGIWE